MYLSEQNYVAVQGHATSRWVTRKQPLRCNITTALSPQAPPALQERLPLEGKFLLESPFAAAFMVCYVHVSPIHGVNLAK